VERVAADPRALIWKAPLLVWSQFEDSTDLVVFNAVSSHVHLINEHAYRLWLLATDGQPHGVEDLAEALASPGEPLTKAALEMTRDTLVFMDSEGLLQPVRE
jgi:hypothetical protein